VSIYPECPSCGSDKWEFHFGAREPDHRFGGSEPDEGYCSDCDFQYQEHIRHPMPEQVKRHKESTDAK